MFHDIPQVPWWRDVWSCYIPPSRSVLTLWLLLDRLPTDDHLCRAALSPVWSFVYDVNHLGIGCMCNCVDDLLILHRFDLCGRPGKAPVIRIVVWSPPTSGWIKVRLGYLACSSSLAALPSSDLAYRVFRFLIYLGKMTSSLKELLKTLEGDWFKGKLTRQDHFDALARIEDALNRVPEEFVVEDRRRFMASCFGHFMSMHRELKFSGGVFHQLLLRELDYDGPTDKMRFLLGNHVVWFLKVEFSLITRLHFGVVPDTSMYVAVENGIHQRYFPAHDEVSLDDLRVVLTRREFEQAYDAVNLCLIYMLNWILMGVDERLKIPVWQFHLVEDLNAFDVFPWGAHVYRHSIFSFKHALPRRSEERRQQS
ncbi:hypothetical protein Ddye_013065 [Dipteronia dyeriana]|uniref:DUF1985 domain-containing protein n=1 Tax=Dipteronia dyeriana TaxID=168575 RepID=A0AAD9X5L2_9ROSI|nr:hypothetical protein Ddye_013065 [Dipteronia dyeriana]